MVYRIVWLTLIMMTLPSAGLARPAAPPTSPTPAVTPAARVPAPPAPAASAPASAARNDLDRRAIFDILCGGAMLQDVGVQEHLWRVAGSLAERSWTPPRVTVRMVVDASGEVAPKN